MYLLAADEGASPHQVAEVLGGLPTHALSAHPDFSWFFFFFDQEGGGIIVPGSVQVVSR